MNILECILKIYPDWKGVVIENDPNRIVPHETETRIPTLAELEAADAQLKAEEYKEKRRKEYPPMADYLDGIVKGDTAQVQAYIDACLAVKAKYPKMG